jgi:hypothetical protein
VAIAATSLADARFDDVILRSGAPPSELLGL